MKSWLRRLLCKIVGHGETFGVIDDSDAVPIILFICSRCARKIGEALIVRNGNDIEFRACPWDVDNTNGEGE